MTQFFKLTLIFPIFLLLFSCGEKEHKTQDKQYLRHVGDIPFNKNSDNEDFEICHGESNIMQYFNLGKGLQYKGEKSAILDQFINNFKPVEKSTETGSIRIRFIVNCKGEADRFRTIAMNSNYQEKEFDEAIVSQLVEISKNLDGWKVLYENDSPVDYYQYLIFKIENGQIKEILP